MSSTPLITPAFPERVTLELTNRCNLNCGFCPRKFMEAEQGDMDTGLALRIIDELAEHAPVQVVPFFRGESLLHPHWADILAHIQRRGVGPVQFATNATLLTEKTIGTLLDMELNVISFSLNPPPSNPEAARRHGVNYDACRNNVLAFLEERNKRGSSTVVQVSTVETAQRKPEVADFVAFWSSKADRVRVYAEHSGDGHPGSIAETLPAFDRRLPCRKLTTDMVVYWSGDIAVCNHDWTRMVNGRRLGNAAETSLAALWRSPAYEDLRRRHETGILTGSDVCESCDHWKMYYMENGYLGQLHTREQQA
ncbi:radical SAM/SPASM domain-containing protein [Nitratidesulfovibrio vulgaris]|uniref:radical SAM/SPASM domain-containing protein n=1 Tax=Nitratidesulfovibrio vulgaris TaxID=881 RepID=UPI002300E7F4|nr:radical SAM/SPASM domain-containing protein [Nitratidesulfovibrio vulgaris]WCB46375.1 radical SAM/SPASM domain-containing protein [Nitratidesulfovibrio vulgaris]